MGRPTAIDLFSGGGGLSLGLSNAGFEVLFGVDNWEPAVNAYNSNLKHHCHNVDLFFPEHESLSLMTVTKLKEYCKYRRLKVTGRKLVLIDRILEDVKESKSAPDSVKELLSGRTPDLIAGGPPCQGWSTLGARNDSDPRNELFRSFVKVVERIKPRFFIMENVSGLKHSKNGKEEPRRAQQIIQRFVDAGYPDAKCSQVICADYGVPQRRKRLFFTGSLGGGIDYDLPPSTCEEYVSVEGAIYDLPPVESNESQKEYSSKSLTDFQRLMRGNSTVLHNHSAPNHDQELVDIMSKVPDGGSRKSIPELGWNPDWHHNAYSRLLSTAPATAVTTNLRKPSSNRSTHPTQNRGLTIREGLRLQTFPDSYILEGGVVDQSIIVGNSVPPLLAQRLFEPLANLLREKMLAN